MVEDTFRIALSTPEENAARLERLRIVRLVREALSVKRGPYPDRRKVKAVERLLEELEGQSAPSR